MHGIWASLRQFIVTSKPWQRMVAGVVVIAVGVLLGNYVLTAFGAVFVILPAARWVKRRRVGAAAAGPGDGAGAPPVPVDAGEG